MIVHHWRWHLSIRTIAPWQTATVVVLWCMAAYLMMSCNNSNRNHRQHNQSGDSALNDMEQDRSYFQPPILEDFPRLDPDVSSGQAAEEGLGGRWHARYRDATGTVYDITLDLEQSGDSIFGDATVSGWIQHNSVPAGDFKVFGSISGSTIVFRIDPEKSPQPIAMSFTGRIARYREGYMRCMYGIVDSTESNRFLGGVWIAFR